MFRERFGILSSVDFPAPYPKSSDCSYRIEVEEGFRLRLQFDSRFDVEDHPDVTCPYDYVKVRERTHTQARTRTGAVTDQLSVRQIEAGSRRFGPFCGDQSPGVVQTDSNIVTVRFHSDKSGENLGWKLTYTSEGEKRTFERAQVHTWLLPDRLLFCYDRKSMSRA